MIKEADIFKCKIVKESEMVYDSVGCCADANNVLRMLGLAEATEEFFMTRSAASCAATTGNTRERSPRQMA